MKKTVKKERNKIIEGLKQAVEHAQQPQTDYERIADRVLKATHEFNESLKEAHQCAEMRVFIGASGKGEEHPMQLQPQIYKLTHSTMVFAIKYEAGNPADTKKQMWQQVKSPAFQDASGIGLRALKR